MALRMRVTSLMMALETRMTANGLRRDYCIPKRDEGFRVLGGRRPGEGFQLGFERLPFRRVMESQWILSPMCKRGMLQDSIAYTLGSEYPPPRHLPNRFLNAGGMWHAIPLAFRRDTCTINTEGDRFPMKMSCRRRMTGRGATRLCRGAR